jgi:hypothetical protein
MTTFLTKFWAVTWISDQLPMNVGSPRYGNSDGKPEQWSPPCSWMVGDRSSPSHPMPHLTPKPSPLMVAYGHLWSSQMAIAIFYLLHSSSMRYGAFKSMPSNTSKKITVTLPWVEGEEIEQAALLRGVPAPQIIRERLAEWKQQTAPSANPPLTQLPSSDIGTLLLKTGLERLENLEQASTTTQNMVQQILKEDIPGSNCIELPRFLNRMERLEAILDGIHVLVERIAIDVTSDVDEREAVIQAIQTTLEQILEEKQ